MTEAINDALSTQQVFVTFTQSGSDGRQASMKAANIVRIDGE